MPSSASRLRPVIDTATSLLRAGVVRPYPPHRLLAAGLTLAGRSLSVDLGYAAMAALRPGSAAVVDEMGTATWRGQDDAATALARVLLAAGAGDDGGVGVLARNSRAFGVAAAAAARIGADGVYLNTGSAGPQLRDIVEREGIAAIVVDADLEPSVAEAVPHLPRVVVTAGLAPQPRTKAQSFEEAVAGDATPLPPPGRSGRYVLLTSGTTGVPKGAPRSNPEPTAVLAMLAGLPLRAGETWVVPAPLFHAWGFNGLTLQMVLGTTMVLRRRFDPELVLADVAGRGAEVLWAVPVMLQRIMALPEETRRRHDTSSLRCIAVSGSALPAGLAARVEDTFGPVLHSVYGSTEVGWAAIATAADLAADPATAGHPARGTDVAVLDDHDQPVEQGRTGRIFVGSGLAFDGYTGGGDKARLGRLVATGDTGHVDEAGRLTVEGREDDMIVSGGENVFPREVEDVLTSDPSVAEVAVIGVPDDEFGQRLAAFVVAAEGASVDTDALRSLVRGRLARYKVPREVTVVDELPRNATGKVLARELRDR